MEKQLQLDIDWRSVLTRHLSGLSLSPPLSVSAVDGLESLSLLATAAGSEFPRLCLLVRDEHAAASVAGALEEWCRLLGQSAPELVMVPEMQGERRRWIPENEALRAAAMSRALHSREAIFIGSPAAFAAAVPPPEQFAGQRLSLRAGDQSGSLEELVEALVRLDYDNEIEVRVPGEFARRGGIVDVFSPLYEYPARIEYFGEEIESIRFFDAESQRSINPCHGFDIVPRGERVLGEPGAGYTFLDYLGAESYFLLWRPRVIEEHLERFAEPSALSWWRDFQNRQRSRIITFAPPEDRGAEESFLDLDWAPLGASFRFDELSVGGESALLHWQILRVNLLRWHQAGYAVVAACGNQGEADRFREMLEADTAVAGLPVEIVSARLPGGLFIPSARLVMLGETEIFGKPGRSPAETGRGRYQADYRWSDENQLHKGDFAVHASHGIALFHGVRELETRGVLQEVLELEFADSARLYVPMEQAWLVSRYIGTSRRAPKLSRIGGGAWQRNRAAAAEAAYDLAAELIQIEAMRHNAKGLASSEDPHWERSFAASFPFPETPDQSQAIEEVLADMASSEPMDRLLCGDVGYGKTEVAMRAAFRAVTNNRQVAVLVPTTLLAQQHLYAFRQRMAEYPINIEMLSRFRTETEQLRILARLAEGGVDILIGTHRLLQKDVVFANLGLIVIDEEQRFGVRHKERLKRMRASVDILTMTATPIPRTLYFSLSGIRNLSTIMSPPAERLPVTTVVAQNDDDLVRRAVLRELERGGQVFYLHNRVRSIAAEARRLQRLLPEARLVVAHGRMPAAELEDAMQKYLQGQVDVLVCTTIIESGLDIPNANTIIIQDADRFGLAELYQLRGRVGRYHHQAYAYLLVSPAGMPARNARRRLAAIRQYTRLGAGMQLALRDLEIRGAGNILGAQQSGHIASVGFELYCEILREAVSRLKRQPPMAQARSVVVSLPGIQFGMISDQARGDREPSSAAACLPAWYIQSEQLRLQYHRRLSRLAGEDEWRELADELKDRFGPPPAEARNILEIARLRLHAAARNISSVTVRQDRLILETSQGVVKDRNQRLPRLQSQQPIERLAEIITLIEELG